MKAALGLITFPPPSQVSSLKTVQPGEISGQNFLFVLGLGLVLAVLRHLKHNTLYQHHYTGFKQMNNNIYALQMFRNVK